MDLSIVIVNWNGWTVLNKCLDSIFNTPQGIHYEVIVVDNASQDDSIALLKREYPQVVLVCNKQNLGFGAANNQAFALARGRHILLLNNDTLLMAGALVESVRYMDANPQVGALGCRIEFPDRTFQTSCYRFNNLIELFMVRLMPLGSVARERLNIGRYWGRQFNEPVEVDVVAGCFMMVRHEVVLKTGGFDEDFFMYGEDEEWCSRIKRSGWRVMYFPGATIIHIHRFSSRQARRALRIVECMAPVLVLHKRRGLKIAWLANLILLFGMIIRLPAWLVMDGVHVLRGSAQKNLIQSRLVAFSAHLKGILWPLWLPGVKK